MAKDILSLEKQLMLLESKKEAQLKVLKNDVSIFVDSIKPGNLIKLGFNDLLGVGSNNGAMSPAFTGIAGFLGTFLLDRFVFKRGSFVHKILASALTSGIVNDIASGDNSFLKKWALKLKDKFSSKDNIDLETLFDEVENSDPFPDDLNTKA